MIKNNNYDTTSFDDFHDEVRVTELTSLDQLEQPITQRIFSWWLNNESTPPKKSSFDILDHFKYASHLYLVKRLEPHVFKFIVTGEDINWITGYNSHNLTIYKQDHPNADKRNFNLLIDYYETLISTQKCHGCVGEATLNIGANKNFESVDCPLLDENGEVTYLLGAMQLT